jgi:uncharacterized radical SAM superfamily Fe-S cluster-containing enzyme
MSAVRILHRTRCHCCDCGTLHDAELLEEDGGVVLALTCPVRGPRRTRVSSDAAIYSALRRKSTLGAPPLDRNGFTWLNLVELTRDCNARCPVCYADALPGAGSYLSLAEVVAIAERLKREGLLSLTLTGGEPTLHPQLPEIVAAVRRLGLDATVVSNGLRLGSDPGLAERLRRSGLSYLYLQLDTLRPEVNRRLRRDDGLPERLRALEHADRAGLRFGVDVTVFRDNLDEVGSLLQHAATLTPRLGLVNFLIAGRTGRFLLEDEARVTREDVIAALCRSGAVQGITPDHFWPFPRFAPLGLDLHPDCAAILPLGVDRGRLRPLEELLDVGKVWRRLAAARGRVDRGRAAAVLSASVLRSLRGRGVGPLARMLAGLVSGRGESSFLTVVVEQYADGELQDEERIARCTTCHVTRDGRRLPMCAFQHADPRRSPETRAARRRSAP